MYDYYGVCYSIFNYPKGIENLKNNYELITRVSIHQSISHLVLDWFIARVFMYVCQIIIILNCISIS